MSSPPFSDIKKSLGIVFGDIGTSPIYTLSVIFILISPIKSNIFGIVSLLFWTMIILVTIQYAILAMRLSETGEGGTIVLREMLLPMLKNDKKNRKKTIFTYLTFIGVSLMMGDCVLTPSVSILSAVEGVNLIPGEGVSENILVIAAIVICFLLFFIQKRGTDKVSGFFGPVMILWFSIIAIFGAISIILTPEILFSLSPLCALEFFLNDPIHAFLSLSMVILCATGGESLFADMGHLGREPIQYAWVIVLISLTCAYLGQGAFLLRTGDVDNPFFSMIYSIADWFFIPFLVLAIIATIIASQAVISGIFSVIYQAITTHLLPRLPISYTSSDMQSQVYINSINWMLGLAVIIMLIVFRSSANLASAYGFAVSGSMLITGILLSAIFYLKKNSLHFIVALGVTFVDLVFFASLVHKIPYGGYVPIVIASVPFTVFYLYRVGNAKLFEKLHRMTKDEFLEKFTVKYKKSHAIPGTAIFFVRSIDEIPAYMLRTIFKHGIIYTDNVIVSVSPTKKPYGVNYKMQNIQEGLRYFCLRHGYMKPIELSKILDQNGIRDAIIFYGMEDIVSNDIRIKGFALIKTLTPTFVQYYRLPPDQVHGVVTRIEI